MKWITNKTYNTLPDIYLNDHNRQFKKMDDGTLLKTVNLECKDAIYKLVKKSKIEHVIFPKDIVRVLFLDKVCYTQEYAKGMENLSSFAKFSENYSDREILEFFKSMLVTLSKIHQCSVVSGDITYSNIILNENLDYNFIDFELAFVDDMDGLLDKCADEVPFLEFCQQDTLRQMYGKKDMFLYFDKANLINIMLYAINFGTIPQIRLLSPFRIFSSLEMPEQVVSKIKCFLAPEVYTADNNYLIDVVDHLIESDYQLPYRKRK